MKITIKVRPQQDDSNNCSTACPVAQALRVAVGLPRTDLQHATRLEVMAQPSRLFARNGAIEIHCDTPPDVALRMKRWDERREMEAFDFEVEATPPTTFGHRLGNYLFPGWQPPGGASGQ